jgi:hypothetical protein
MTVWTEGVVVMTAIEDPAPPGPGFIARVGAGVVGGLAGGVVFGILMQVTGVIPMVAQLIGHESILVGWGVHMAIAAFVGTTYALFFGWFAVVLSISTLMGAFYGLVWWVFGGLTLMPLRLGMGLFVFDTAAWQSLAGHFAYGLVLGVAYPVVAHVLAGTRTRGRHAERSPARGAATGRAARSGSDDRRSTVPEVEQQHTGLKPLSAETRSLRERQQRSGST